MIIIPVFVSILLVLLSLLIYINFICKCTVQLALIFKFLLVCLFSYLLSLSSVLLSFITKYEILFKKHIFIIFLSKLQCNLMLIFLFIFLIF